MQQHAATGVEAQSTALERREAEPAQPIEALRVEHRLDPAASALHSVNTVSWDGDQLVGSSTDGAGFVASLADAGVVVDGARVAIIGAGGAARSLVEALARAGSVDITVLNRTADKAEAAATALWRSVDAFAAAVQPDLQDPLPSGLPYRLTLVDRSGKPDTVRGEPVETLFPYLPASL